jgi:hypothetical protein
MEQAQWTLATGHCKETSRNEELTQWTLATEHCKEGSGRTVSVDIGNESLQGDF